MTDKISVAPVEGMETDIILSKLEVYPELHICIRYLLLLDEGYSKEVIANMLHAQYASMPETRVGLYGRIERWRKDGTMREAEAICIAPRLEEMRDAVQYAIKKYAEGIRLMADDVTNPKISLKTRTEAMAFLKQEVVAPRLSIEEEPGAREKNYVSKPRDFQPTNVED